jgi:diacylglycerol kinase (ATP)
LISVIANPVAGRGRARKLLPELQALIGARTTVLETSQAGDEGRLANQAVLAGSRTIIAVGGDGTCSQIAGAILKSGRDCALAVLPCGTGNDFAKILGVANYTPRQIVSLVERHESQRIDVGIAEGHYFINSCGFGFGASVLEGIKRVRLLRGNSVYVYSALRQLLTYRAIEVARSGGAAQSRRMLMVTISNGRWLGGAFFIAPNASVQDGALNVAFFAESGAMERIRAFARALKGTHATLSSVATSMEESLSLRFRDKPAMEIDGELRYASSESVEVTCRPRALSVIGAPGFPQ